MEEIEYRCRNLLKRFKSVGVDTMAFIYFFEDNPTYVPFVKPLFELIEDGLIKGVTSIITRLEILVKPKRERNFELVEKYEAILDNFPNLELLPIDRGISNIASDLRAKYEIKTPDAIQVASSLLKNAQVFITNDDNLKKIKELKIIVMDEILMKIKRIRALPSKI